MRKLLFLILTLASVKMAYADASANIKIKISGAASNNRYFLCLPNVGCLSILGAQRGKIFSIYRTVEMSAIYVTDMNTHQLSPQGLPASCKGTVDPNQTLTITGRIAAIGDKVRINGLHCRIS